MRRSMTVQWSTKSGASASRLRGRLLSRHPEWRRRDVVRSCGFAGSWLDLRSYRRAHAKHHVIPDLRNLAGITIRSREQQVFGAWRRRVDTRHQQGVPPRESNPGRLGVDQLLSGDGSAVPFGGYKMSGYGRESGLQHVEEYLNVKAVWIMEQDGLSE